MPAKSKAQFRAMQAAAHGQSTLGIPASVGKEFVKATRSPGKLPKYQHSPDRYDDAQLTSEAPPRHEYHGSPENLNETETPKKAGLSRGKIQQSDRSEERRVGKECRSR